MHKLTFLSLLFVVACAGSDAGKKQVVVGKITPEEVVIKDEVTPIPLRLLVSDYEPGKVPSVVLFPLYNPQKKEIVSARPLNALTSHPNIFPILLEDRHFAIVFGDDEIRLASTDCEDRTLVSPQYCLGPATFADWQESLCLQSEAGVKFCGQSFSSEVRLVPLGVVVSSPVVSTTVTSDKPVSVTVSSETTSSTVVSEKKKDEDSSAETIDFEPVRLIPSPIRLLEDRGGEEETPEE